MCLTYQSSQFIEKEKKGVQLFECVDPQILLAGVVLTTPLTDYILDFSGSLLHDLHAYKSGQKLACCGHVQLLGMEITAEIPRPHLKYQQKAIKHCFLLIYLDVCTFNELQDVFLCFVSLCNLTVHFVVCQQFIKCSTHSGYGSWLLVYVTYIFLKLFFFTFFPLFIKHCDFFNSFKNTVLFKICFSKRSVQLAFFYF